MTRRTDRLGEQFKEVLSELIQRQLKDPRVGFVTITTVRVTPDLSKAHVYWSVFDDATREATQQGLERAAGFLRTETGRQVRLRSLPQLIFHYDDTYERGQRVDHLIDEIHQDDEVAHHDGTTGDDGTTDDDEVADDDEPS